MPLSISPSVLHTLPATSGVYKFKDASGQILYVGKAKNLKNRVSSYFQRDLTLGPKTQMLVSKISSMEYIEVSSELEALILEAELIKRYRPKYNIQLKDDKSYLYIGIRKDAVDAEHSRQYLSKILSLRKTQLEKKDVTFGPYPNGSDVKQLLRLIRRVLPYRDCTLAKFGRYCKAGKPCLYGHVHVCPAPCVSSEGVVLNEVHVNEIRLLLRGGIKSLISSVERKMVACGKNQDYEEAARLRDLVQRLTFLRNDFTRPDSYINNPNLLDDLAEKALKDLVEMIPVLDRLPKNVECYDISNISGKEAVGSLVVARDGRIAKQYYRKFRIKTKNSPDDFYMLKEVIRRRLCRAKGGSVDWELPDLIVVDGGKGQVGAALSVMDELDLRVPVIGLAKRFDLVIYHDGVSYKEIYLDRRSEGFKLLQQLRDESHRFAQKYHHFLRLKQYSR